jgi:sarcosine oxidase subunit beta
MSKVALKKVYEVIIIGGGIQGLSLAYRLAKGGMDDVLLLEEKHLGVGASGRNGESVRSCFGSKEWINLHHRSIRLWENMAQELDFNVMFSRHGFLVLASTPKVWPEFADRVKLQNALGLKTKLLKPHEIMAMVPELNQDIVYGGYIQPEAGTARHDGAIWAFAKASKRNGVKIREHTKVHGILIKNEKVEGVRTSAGDYFSRNVVNAAGVADRKIASLAGIKLPVSPIRDEAMVTEPLKPFLSCALSAPAHWSYAHQTARGEYVGGSNSPEMSNGDSSYTSLAAMRKICQNMVDLFPGLRGVKLMRIWAGGISCTPDNGPILGPVDELEGFILSCGWGGYGFMGGPAGGDVLAEWMLTGVMPSEMRPFTVNRFKAGKLVDEPSIIGQA